MGAIPFPLCSGMPDSSLKKTTACGGLTVRRTADLRRLWGPTCDFTKRTHRSHAQGSQHGGIRGISSLGPRDAHVQPRAKANWPRAWETRAYNCRKITNGTEFSLHAYGIAADINPRDHPLWQGSDHRYAACHGGGDKGDQDQAGHIGVSLGWGLPARQGYKALRGDHFPCRAGPRGSIGRAWWRSLPTPTTPRPGPQSSLNRRTAVSSLIESTGLITSRWQLTATGSGLDTPT